MTVQTEQEMDGIPGCEKKRGGKRDEKKLTFA
jgi:hypothetical protein